MPRGRALTVVAVGLFLVLAAVGILHHEMWRDELEIWLIARDSGSPSELLANMRTEAHPVLWYALNFLVTRFSHDPLSMQLTNLLIGAVAVAVFLAWAPFGPLQRALFCFGYFPFYEFTIISRNYALQLMLTFVFCALFARARHAWVRQAVVLALLAQTHLYGTVLAALLGLLLLGEVRRGVRRREAKAGGRAVLALGLAFSSVAVAGVHLFYQVNRLGAAHTPAVATWDLPWLARSLSSVYYGYLPIPNVLERQFWNSNILSALPAPAGLTLGAVLGLGLLAGSAVMLRRRPPALWVFLTGSAVFLGITFFFFKGYLRHHGQIYLLFWTCYWLYRVLPGEPAAEQRAQRVGGRLLTAILVAQVAAAGYAFAQDLVRPFSRAREVGAYLQQPSYRDAVLVGSVDYAAQSVAAWVDRPIYYPESKSFGTFLDWGETRKRVTSDVVLRDAVDLMRQRGRDVVVILSYEVNRPVLGESVRLGPGMVIECIARFPDAIADEESFFLYRVFDPGRSRG